MQNPLMSFHLPGAGSEYAAILFPEIENSSTDRGAAINGNWDASPNLNELYFWGRCRANLSWQNAIANRDF